MNITKSQRITLACFLGGTIGALVALQISAYFWWIGIFAGGSIGYLAYGFEEVLKAARAVWLGTIKERHLYWGAIKLVGYCAAAIGCVFFYPAILIGSIHSPQTLFRDVTVVLILGFLAGLISSLGGVIESVKNSKIAEDIAFGRRLLWYLNPLCALFFVVYYGIKGLAWLVMRVPIALTFVVLFVQRVFLLVHSELRLLCMTDAMVGALAGYFAGNVFIGGVVGAIVGVLNYELISVRWLKLVRR